ncbi:MAG: family 20 glycosylhydrolase [Lentisphaeria bacterium]|nr:family 20 glycosylhydrolase [Lentisphaeria bacterium]
MKLNYEIRAVQVDLARQMETIPFLKGFIDFIAENHYNTLFLYLEWRIRTRTFDIGKAEGYSAAELREIIEYAALRGITVIPGLASLGHAELLLRREKFASYSELREGIKGRFGNTFTPDLCPSLPETREFLDSYLSDVAEIFTETPYFHVGGDEVWDLGFCSECRKKAAGFEGDAKLYLEHFQFVHQLVTKLGKRMMLWDDMFEYYPQILPDMPRDIIMVDWQYQENVSGYQGHFCNLCFRELFREYDKLGFDYLTAPADFCWNNIDTSTAHGDKFKPMGGLLTSWEKSTSLLYKYFPTMAAAGQLWANAAEDGDSAMDLALRQLFGIDDEPFLHAVAQYGNFARRISNVNLNALKCFSFFGPDVHQLHSLQTIVAVLMQYPGKLRDTRAELVLNDILGDCILKLLEARCKRACWNLLHGQQGEDLTELENEVAEAVAKYADFIEQHRRKRDSAKFRSMIDGWIAALRELQEKARSAGLLSVLFALPDGFGAERLRILVNGDEIGSGVFKGPGTFFEIFFFLPAATVVKEVRIEGCGFAGQGVAYVSARTAKGTFVPAGIAGCSGLVEHPEYALTPNVNYAWLGSRDVIGCFRDRTLAEAVHAICLTMKKKDTRNE